MRILFMVCALAFLPTLLIADTVYFYKDDRPYHYRTYDEGDGYIRIIKDGQSWMLRRSFIRKIEKNDMDEDSYPPTPQNHSKSYQSTPLPAQQTRSTNNPIASIPIDKAKADVKEHLARQYPDSFSTQKLLYDANMKSYQFLVDLPEDDVTNRILTQLFSYYPSFSTIKLLYESNMKAYKSLHSGD